MTNRYRSHLGYVLTIIFLYALGFMSLMSVYHRQPAMIGLSLIAFTFGLRHGFDVDHIAAIDNTVRKLLQQKKDPTGVGFFFSLGHSTVVFILAVLTMLATRFMETSLPQFEKIGSVLGTSISGLFLLIIGGLNLLVLMDLLRMFHRYHEGKDAPDVLEKLLDARGFFNRFLGFTMKMVNKSWHIYPVGFLFGLGFDTASEVALLTISATVARGSTSFWGMLGLPLFFAAGMVTVDAIDGMLMTSTYKWAFSSPLRKLYYNVSVTGLAVTTALVIGLVEVGQVIVSETKLQGSFWTWLQQINFGELGYVLVTLFVVVWLISFGGWKLMKLDVRKQ